MQRSNEDSRARSKFDSEARGRRSEGYICLTKLRHHGVVFFEFCDYFLPVNGAKGCLVIADAGWDLQGWEYAVRPGEVFVSGHPEFQYILSGLVDLDAIEEQRKAGLDQLE